MELTTTTKKEHLINFLDAFETDPCSDIIQLKEDKKIFIKILFGNYTKKKVLIIGDIT